MSVPPRARELGVIGCHSCGLVCEDKQDASIACPRCGTTLHRRKVNSITRAWAFLLAGLIFYVPANILPVMYTSMLGSGGDSTIMSGVVEFWHSGSWDIALIIFIASVAVPCTKFLVLGFLLVTTGRHSQWAKRRRARLYRMVEFIGYWSMLDVVVVALVTALVQFNALSHTEARIGICFFGLTVIFTMLSAMSFDPRLIWDSESDHEQHI
ncbi:paraquat-inducible protein A [Herminiimonas arsenitoxidans]|uniref:paraquat-inducible protein A n=1 Tax=Herminiimonas arsenitoxidans TaxID=1809410 RepID=UPI0009710EFB|nr:paraquat-inducible protein A [Herminiimonas arsenitoxidans]